MSGDIRQDHVDATWHPRGMTHGMSHVVHLYEWLTLSQVSSGGKRRKEKLRKIKKNVKVTCGKGGKWREVSPTLIHRVGE